MTNDKIITILEASKLKWYNVALHDGIEDGNRNCACCKHFMESRYLNLCNSCPIQQDTGRQVCQSTPYEDWTELFDPEDPPPYQVFDDISRSIAWQEYLYLDALQRKYKAKP